MIKKIFNSNGKAKFPMINYERSNGARTMERDSWDSFARFHGNFASRCYNKQ